MNKINKILTVAILIIMCFGNTSCMGHSIPEIKMYNVQGEEINILETEIELYQDKGWYIEPVRIMYSADGRTRVTLESEVEAYENVGWYIEPVVTMYALDGRTRITLESEVEAYKNVGWYTEPVIVMYAEDGRTQVVLQSEIEANEKVGWYRNPIIRYYNENDVVMLAKLMYGEGRGIPSKTQLACIAWTVLNRYDAGWGNSISSVITSPNQFYYKASFKTVSDHGYDLVALARSVLEIWNKEKNNIPTSGRVLPKEYKWYGGNGRVNRFRTSISITNCRYWDYSLPTPYEN